MIEKPAGTQSQRLVEIATRAKGQITIIHAIERWTSYEKLRNASFRATTRGNPLPVISFNAKPSNTRAARISISRRWRKVTPGLVVRLLSELYLRVRKSS